MSHETASIPLWRRKNDPIDKQKILSQKPDITVEEKEFNSKYFKSIDVAPVTKPPVHKAPSTARYVPQHIKSSFPAVTALEEPANKVVIGDFPALGGNSKKIPQTPKNTPDTINYLEAARRAPLHQPKSSFDDSKKSKTKKESSYGDFEEPKDEEYIPEQTNYQWECQLETYNEDWVN